MLKNSVFWFISISIFALINAGVMHTPELNKEREDDGAYSPRDHSHFSPSGEHLTDFDHEAIIGSHKEAEEYDSLPREESKRRLQILLNKMDLNGDKHIDTKELKSWIMRSFKVTEDVFRMLSEEEAQDKLEDADENRDGIISWKEYLSDAYGVDDDENDLSIMPENEEVIAEDRLMWKAADMDHDGNLNAKEWVAFSHPEENPAMLPIILEQTLKDKDKNGDGAIDFQEYVGESAKKLEKHLLEIEKEKFDNQLDANHDGKLEGNEILSWIVPSNEEIAEEEVEHLFGESDTDEDGLLSFEEVLDHHDVFVGSEATDYGDHLHNIHQFQDEL